MFVVITCAVGIKPQTHLLFVTNLLLCVGVHQRCYHGFISDIADVDNCTSSTRPLVCYRYVWLFYINPNYYGFSAMARILLNDLKFECAYDSELECYPFSSDYIMEYFGLNTVQPFVHVMVSVWYPRSEDR